jgi:sugar phosphate isomerase/epimerase
MHPSLGGATTMSWTERIDIASRAGFGAVDLTLPEIAGEGAGVVRERLEAGGVCAATAPLPVEFRREEARFRADLADLPALAALAATVGIRTVYRSLPASSTLPAGKLESILRRRLLRCASILREHGISLALEALGPLHRRRAETYEFLWRLRDCADFAASCGEGVGVLVDSWHWHHADDSTASIVELGDSLLHVHLADAPPLPATEIRDDERLLPGDGVIDSRRFFAALAEAGYEGFLSPEIPGRWCTTSSALDCARMARDAAVHWLGTPPPPDSLVRIETAAPIDRTNATGDRLTPSAVTVSYRSAIATRAGSTRSPRRRTSPPPHPPEPTT